MRSSIEEAIVVLAPRFVASLKRYLQQMGLIVTDHHALR
jgi:hypothetical protein